MRPSFRPRETGAARSGARALAARALLPALLALAAASWGCAGEAGPRPGHHGHAGHAHHGDREGLVTGPAAGAAPGPARSAAAAPSAESARVLLLGEVHDNPHAHRARLALLRARVDAGWRPAIAMEQFDRERQAELDRAQATCRDAACVVRAAAPARAGWDWTLYAPLIELALRHRLPLVAANLSTADAMRVMREGFAAALDPGTVARYRLDAPLPADLVAGQREAVAVGHCRLLPESMLDGMARAQIARDVWMAESVRRHAARGVALLAGNGHLVADLGVPRWLDEDTRRDARVVAFLEPDGSRQDAPRFDDARVVPAQPRPDPCAQVRPGARGR